MQKSDFSKEPPTPGRKAPSEASIQDWLIDRIAESLEIDPTVIDIREPLASYGLSSVASLSLTGDLEEWLELRLDPTLAWDYPTIEELAKHLAEKVKRKGPSASS